MKLWGDSIARLSNGYWEIGVLFFDHTLVSKNAPQSWNHLI